MNGHDVNCDGWLGVDDEDRPRPCPVCKPHLPRHRRALASTLGGPALPSTHAEQIGSVQRTRKARARSLCPLCREPITPGARTALVIGSGWCHATCAKTRTPGEAECATETKGQDQ